MQNAGTAIREHTWRDFLHANCAAMFQTALLLTDDANLAETALTSSIDSLDLSRPPEPRDLEAWEQVVAIRSIETSRLSSPSSNLAARSMLQPGLLPLLDVDRVPRICFVLRMLLRYSTNLSAQILGVEENKIRILFQTAALQLQRQTERNREHEYGSLRRLTSVQT